MTPPVCLTVAGTDSGGAAGVAADLATFAALGVHGACVVTAVTAQDTLGVHDVHPIPATTVECQLHAVSEDLPIAAVKTGMLGSADVVVRLSLGLAALRDSQPVSIVVDPVLVATSGAVLGDSDVERAYVEALLPIATVVTPNLDEARALAGVPDAAAPELAGRLSELGPAVVVTGGPDGASHDALCTDWLARPGTDPVPITHPAVPTDHDHGTGCTYSSALAAHLAHGSDLATACDRAAAYVGGQLALSRHWSLGRGRGPIAHVAGTYATDTLRSVPFTTQGAR